MKLCYPTLLFLFLAAPLLAQPDSLAGTDAFTLTPLGTLATGAFDEGAAEIATYDASSRRLFFTNARDNSLGIVDLSAPATPTLLATVDLSPYGAGVNSVSARDGVVAVAVQAATVDGNGTAVLLDTEGQLLATYAVGALPDMITWTSDGKYVLTANEGEPSDDYTVDPEGSVSVIDLSAGVTAGTVSTAGFTAYNDRRDALLSVGVRLFGPNATVAQDLEPEYIAVVGDTLAYVTLQENNAIAVVRIATAQVIDIMPQGYKDHRNSGFDASNRDEAINITPHAVLGMYQSDAIATYTVDGTAYLVTANEGDARDYEGYSEEARIADLVLDPEAYPDADALQQEDVLGRLTTSTAFGDTDGDGDVDQLYAFGGRSFSIYRTDGTLVYDSGEALERITAAADPDNFNSTNTENDSFDNRSDDKGPEPEAVEVAYRDGRTYALIGLERVGGIVVYDVTDPTAPFYVSYVNNRDFGVDAQAEDGSTNPAVGDLGVEDILFIPASDSPTGEDLVVTANEISGTVTVFTVSGDYVSATHAVSPELLSLGQYPNPFTADFTVTYTLETPTTVSFDLFDLQGRLLRPGAPERREAGTHTRTFAGSTLPAGTYLLRARIGDRHTALRLLKR